MVYQTVFQADFLIESIPRFFLNGHSTSLDGEVVLEDLHVVLDGLVGVRVEVVAEGVVVAQLDVADLQLPSDRMMEEEQNGLKVILQYQMSLTLLNQFTMFPATKMYFEVI